MKQRAMTIATAGCALALILAAALVSHSWNEDAGLDPLYVILALVVLALSLPATREWLREATNVKLPGGFEVTRQSEDAVEAAAALPDVTEEGSETGGDSSPKILDADWRTQPRPAVGKLQAQLSRQLSWVEREIYQGQTESDKTVINKIRNDTLIRPDQARLLEAIGEINGDTVEREFSAGGETKEAMVTFLLHADRVVYSLRLIVLDKWVRNKLAHDGYAVMDIGSQPAGRWPDFYAFVPERPGAKPFRVMVRIALDKDSDFLPKMRKRLRDKKVPETPLDPQAQPVIVIPRISKAQPEDDPDLPVVRRHEFPGWIAEQLGPDAPDTGLG